MKEARQQTQEAPLRRTGRPAGRWLRWLRGAFVLLLLVLVSGWLLTKTLVARAERKHPPAGELVRLASGHEQHVVRRGTGPPIVLVHGAFGTGEDFLATVVPDLEQRYQCLVWDRPGHGYSERPEGDMDPGVQADFLLELIDALDLDEPPLLVGFSYGGAVALAAGLEAPEAWRGIVLLNGPSHPWPDPLDLQYAVPTLPFLGPLLVETWMMPVGIAFSDMSVEHAFSPLPVPPTFENSPIGLALRPTSLYANTADIRLLKPFLRAQSANYEQLNTPLTLVVSEDDLVVSPTIHSPALHAAAPQSRMLRIPNAGHQILYTHTELVIEVIDEVMAAE